MFGFHPRHTERGARSCSGDGVRPALEELGDSEKLPGVTGDSAGPKAQREKGKRCVSHDRAERRLISLKSGWSRQQCMEIGQTDPLPAIWSRRGQSSRRPVPELGQVTPEHHLCHTSAGPGAAQERHRAPITSARSRACCPRPGSSQDSAPAEELRLPPHGCPAGKQISSAHAFIERQRRKGNFLLSWRVQSNKNPYAVGCCCPCRGKESIARDRRSRRAELRIRSKLNLYKSGFPSFYLYY